MHHKLVLTELNKELHEITPRRLTIKKALQIGHVMEIFYKLYYNPKYTATTEYSFKFTGWIENIEGLKNSINQNKINYCKFSKKSTSFTDAYFPATIDTEPITNTYNVDSNILITGPNAAGKTTLLKSTLFNMIISQQIGVGFYKNAKINPYDKIHCYINIPDTSNRDSLFQAEARRCKEILTDITTSPKERHFCIFDELYSGTNPYEAISSAISFLIYLNKQKNSSFMLTTHFLDLCRKLEKEDNIVNHNMQIEVENDEFIYTYKLVSGISDIRGGVKVLKQLDYPKEIISTTEEIIETLHL
jgi:DNA mismatch repair ATPase MutS